MEEAFRARRKAPAAECRVPLNTFAAMARRLEEFMQPFRSHLQRHEQRSHAVTAGVNGPIVVETIHAHVASGQRNRTNDTKEMLIMMRDKDRDSDVVQTDDYLSNAHPGTPLRDDCHLAHRIEECFHQAKRQVGLAAPEIATWTGFSQRSVQKWVERDHAEGMAGGTRNRAASRR